VPEKFLKEKYIQWKNLQSFRFEAKAGKEEAVRFL